MIFKRYREVCAAVAIAVLPGGCAHFERDAVSVPVELPEAYAATADNGAEFSDSWWLSFGDEKLNLLIEEALGGNFGLEQARQRLEQSAAVARKAGAAQFPQLNLGASAARSKSRIQTPAGSSLYEADRFGLNLAASYELDLWGGVSAAKRAAAIDVQAAADSLETAAVSLSAQVAETWYRLAAFDERLTLLQAQIKNSEDQLHLVEMRFNTGQAVALDVWQQREQLAGLRTLKPRLEASVSAARHQLALLLGRTPNVTDGFDAPALVELPPLPATGVPADLIESRPDVRAALNRVRSANERVAVAIADRLPSLRLTASAGYSAPEAADLFDDLLWNIAGNILGPVIDGGRRRAEAERVEAVMRERLAGYGATLLTAMREVEDALVNEAKQQEVIALQQKQHDAAGKTLYHARLRYRRGLTDYLPVMNALNREQILAQTMVDNQRELLSYRIQLCRALGGTVAAEYFDKKDERGGENDE